MSKVAVVGVGGVGGLIAASLRGAGKADVTLVSRGVGMEVLKSKGLSVETFEGRTHHFDFRNDSIVSVDEAAQTTNPHDVVFLCTKAHQLVSALDAIPSLVGENTAVIPCMNGLPWWFFHHNAVPSGQHSGLNLISTDPTGRLAREIPFARIVGCVANIHGSVLDSYHGWKILWPSHRNEITIGDPTYGAATTRAHNIATLFEGSSIPIQVNAVDNIRSHIFSKLLINATINPVGALTRADCAQIVEDESGNGLVRDLVEESTMIANALSPPVPLTMNADAVLDMYKGSFGLQSSMLQDSIRDSSVEKDSIMGSLVELGRIVGVPTPNLNAVLSLVNIMETAASQRAGLASFWELRSADTSSRAPLHSTEAPP